MSPIYVPGKATLRNQPSAWAEGGDTVYDIEISGTVYRVHIFTTVGTSELVVMEGGSFEYLVVAGGGGAAGRHSGGGGGGGFLEGQLTLSVGQYSAIVGAGGVGMGNPGSVPGGTRTHTNGGNSSLANVIAIGGGRGDTYLEVGSGGSGGGAGFFASSAPQGGSGTAGQGNAGGNGDTGSPYLGGGGGGAGQAGANSQPTTAPAGKGGDGKISTITGQSTYYAGGGGGSTYQNLPPSGAPGGLGGGGSGATVTDGNGGNGVNGLGGGGGGGTGSNVGGGFGGNGGSGIVIVRYAI